MIVIAVAQQTIAIIVALVVAAGWVLYLLANSRRAKPEVGSELELAPNRKPYLDDDDLEGPKLERALGWSLVGLGICAVGLPLYWLGEPGRQTGAIENFEETFIGRGADLFATTEAGGFNCAGCHGGMAATGGVAAYTITQPVLDEAGQPVLDENGEPETELAQVQWKAPALNTALLRYSEEEVLYVLRYGRPFSPMPAWGVEGGGPMTEQQLTDLVAYIRSIQISPEEAKEEAAEGLEQALATGTYSSRGEALFNLEIAGGAYGCARCHTQGWSWGEPGVPGGGAFGPSLQGGGTIETFPLVEDHIDFITNSAEEGEAYGVQGQMDGGGQMPAFGQMLTEDMIAAIVEYERALGDPEVETSPDVAIDDDDVEPGQAGGEAGQQTGQAAQAAGPDEDEGAGQAGAGADQSDPADQAGGAADDEGTDE